MVARSFATGSIRSKASMQPIVTNAPTANPILLDLDGTLSDSRPGIVACFRYMLDELGHDPTLAGDLTWAVGPPIRVSIAQLLGQYDDERVDQGVACYRARYSTVAIYDCTVYPGVVQMLDALRAAGHAMCIATSKRRDFAERVIAHLGLGAYLRGIYGALPEGGLDDKRDLISHILNREGFSPADTVMLGDRLHDVHAAKANAVRAIGAGWGYGGEAELIAAGADAIATTPGDVAGLIAN
jgi:phosphoglycolate phosphatase